MPREQTCKEQQKSREYVRNRSNKEASPSEDGWGGDRKKESEGGESLILFSLISKSSGKGKHKERDY